MATIVDKVKKAMVTKCMAEGIESPDQIALIAIKAIRSLGKMSAAGYKAHATRRNQSRWYR